MTAAKDGPCFYKEAGGVACVYRNFRIFGF